MVDPHVLVKVVLRDDLPNTAAGKFRWVVNEYANNNVLQPPGNRPE